MWRSPKPSPKSLALSSVSAAGSVSSTARQSEGCKLPPRSSIKLTNWRFCASHSIHIECYINNVFGCPTHLNRQCLQGTEMCHADRTATCRTSKLTRIHTSSKQHPQAAPRFTERLRRRVGIHAPRSGKTFHSSRPWMHKLP